MRRSKANLPPLRQSWLEMRVCCSKKKTRSSKKVSTDWFSPYCCRANSEPARRTNPDTVQDVLESQRKPDDAPDSLFSIDSSRGIHINDWIPTLPEFLIKKNFQSQLEAIRANIGKTDVLKPLLPQPIATRLIQNSFSDIRASQLFELSYVLKLLKAQYAISDCDPAGSPSRWAVVNATVALAVRFKTAPGAEDEIAPIASAYFDNATAVMYDLIQSSPAITSIQALLCMALFIEHEPQNVTFALLLSSVARQLQLLPSFLPTKLTEHRRLCDIANELKAKLSRPVHG